MKDENGFEFMRQEGATFFFNYKGQEVATSWGPQSGWSRFKVVGVPYWEEGAFLDVPREERPEFVR